MFWPRKRLPKSQLDKINCDQESISEAKLFQGEKQSKFLEDLAKNP